MHSKPVVGNVVAVWPRRDEQRSRMENLSRMSNGQPAPKRLKTNAEDFKVSANDCIDLYLVDPRKASLFPSSACVTKTFKPEFTHQLFGDDEEILGYKGLSVNIYFSQIDFTAYVDVKFSHKIHGATDIHKILRDNFPAGILQDPQQFVSKLSETSDHQLQHLGDQLTVPTSGSSVQVTHTSLADSSAEVKVRQ